jgi:hypothetical protein
MRFSDWDGRRIVLLQTGGRWEDKKAFWARGFMNLGIWKFPESIHTSPREEFLQIFPKHLIPGLESFPLP